MWRVTAITVHYLLLLNICSELLPILLVLDLVSQVRDVVLVMCIFSSGKPQGVGILERGVYGEGMEMGKSVYEQPGPRWTGSYCSKEGSQ
jgi:hypothetical protein